MVVLAIDPNEDDDEFTGSLNLNTMQNLRSLEERLLSLPVILQATLKTIDALKHFNQHFWDMKLFEELEVSKLNSQLDTIVTRVRGYLGAVEVLRYRTASLIKIVSGYF
jgi:hypothetical protein